MGSYLLFSWVESLLMRGFFPITLDVLKSVAEAIIFDCYDLGKALLRVFLCVANFETEVANDIDCTKLSLIYCLLASSPGLDLLFSSLHCYVN